MKIWNVNHILQQVDDSKENNLKNRLQGANPKNDDTQQNRPLASMSRHNGVVTCAKFSPDSRFLASGSDDKIVLIWEKDDERANRPKQFGESEADLEHWTVRKRLVAHDNDVQDICWSPDGALLITVGLDRSIIIWNAVSFERIKRYDIHQSMVKGIVFDPANKFFATASDDRTVRIFRYSRKLNDPSSNNYEFQMEHIVVDPFKKSPLTSYFRRLSWSPDGQHIAVPNATNGSVTAVVIINRGNWATDVSLIGHEAPCEVCSFSPRLFRQKSSSVSKKDNLTTILATGGQDRTLAVWSTTLTRPLVVAEDIVENAITDMCWTPDGRSLFLTSLDGSVTCVTFEENELGETVAEHVNDSQLLRYGGDRDLAIFAESTQQLRLEDLASTSVTAAAKEGALLPPANFLFAKAGIDKKNNADVMPPAPPQAPVENEVPSVKRPKKINQTVKLTKEGKKRVAPTLLSTTSVPPKASNISQPIVKKNKGFSDIGAKLSQTPYYLPKLGLQTSVHGLRLRNLRLAPNGVNNMDSQDNDNEDMGIDESAAANNQNVTAASLRRKLKWHRRLMMVEKYPTPFRIVSDLPDVLFSNQSVMNYEVSRLIQRKDLVATTDLINAAGLESIDENLLFQVFVNKIEHFSTQSPLENEGTKELLRSIVEVRNGPSWPDDEASLNVDYVQRLDFQDPTQVTVTNDESDEQKRYILYFPYKIQQILPILCDGVLIFYVLISFSGTVQVIHAESGTYAAPAFEVGSNIVCARQNDEFLLLLTGKGLFYTWKLPLRRRRQSFKGVLRGVSIAAVLNGSTLITLNASGNKKNEPLPPTVVETVQAVDVDGRNGMPIVTMKNTSAVFTYSPELGVWTQIVDPWYLLAFKKDDAVSACGDNSSKKIVTRTFDSLVEQIEKGARSRYVFKDENNELQQVMQSRFHELMQCQ